MSKIIGIDLGTTNSCVAVMEDGTTKIISNIEGYKTTPSIVAFDKDGQKIVGEAAKRQLTMNPSRTIASIKRHMGTNYTVKIDNKELTPQIISSMILKKLKDDASTYLNEEVTKAVITVPAYFNDAQRLATKDAGKIAGLEVLRIINEPTAAALAYGLENSIGQKIMVFDLGGGTLDVSIIEIGDGVIEVLSTSGDNHLGGDDFNEAIAKYIVSTFKKENGIDLSKDLTAYQRVIEASEKVKIELSSMIQYTLNIPFICNSKKGPLNLEMTITRDTFNELTKDLVDRTIIPMQNAMSDARIQSNQLNKIILVGGSSRIPAVQAKIKAITNIEPSKSLNPDECVALGAAIQAGKLTGDVTVMGGYDILLLDVTPLTLSIETIGGIATPLIERNTTIPTHHSQIFTTSANFQSSVEIKVLQGERPLAKDNKILGNFRLKGIKKALRGIPQIEVSFDIDANGIVNVSAKDLASGNMQQITIEGSTSMDDKDIEQAIRDAKSFEKDDMSTKERLLFKTEYEEFISSFPAYLKSNKKNLSKDKYTELKTDFTRLKKFSHKLKIEYVDEDTFNQMKSMVAAIKYKMQ